MALDSFHDIAKSSVLLIDLKMPEMDGLTLFQRMKEKSNHLPISLIISESNESRYRISALKSGFLDYLHKGMPNEEIRLRINRAIECKLGGGAKTLEYNGLVIDPLTMKCLLNGQRVFLTKKELEVVLALLQAPEMAIHRDSIIKNIWQKPISKQTLATHMFNVNLKLKEWGYRIFVNNNSIVSIEKD